MPSSLPADLETYVEITQSQLGDCPTAAVASANDRILHEAYSSGTGVCGEVTPESLWQLASATKTYVSALLLNLSHRGLLDLDEAGDNLFDRNLATIRHLATHTSGLHLERPEDKIAGPHLSPRADRR